MPEGPPEWMRAAVPATILVPWLIWRSAHGQRFLPPRQVLLPLLLASIVAQIGGNLNFQQAMRTVGVSVILGIVLFDEPATTLAVLGLTLNISGTLCAVPLGRSAGGKPIDTVRGDAT
jgi:drug/metabolite transporter (DMT)-like permease